MTSINQTLFNPTQLVLQLDSKTLDRAWQQSLKGGNPASRWQQYLNRVALDAFLPWLQAEEDATAKAGLDKNVQRNLWELVNGTQIDSSGAKIVLIPSEAEDLRELRVPQEWVDIPQFQADYYLAVQVSLDSGYLRVWGYATHQKLKEQGSLNYSDRTYSLNDDELITDLDVLWVARELCPEETTQVEVESIAELEASRAENLIQRLGDTSQLLPRLAVPFATWAGLIQNPALCGRLAAQRRGEASKTPVLQWLKQEMANTAAEFGWRQIELAPDMVGARGAVIEAKNVSASGLAKKIAIASQPYELRVIPLAEAGSWRFELCCVTPGCVILPGITLRLLTEDLKSFEGNEDKAIEPVSSLFIDVDLEPGESLIWQVEPTPDNYQLELLQF